jgi:hypothetical protein
VHEDLAPADPDLADAVQVAGGHRHELAFVIDRRHQSGPVRCEPETALRSGRSPIVARRSTTAFGSLRTIAGPLGSSEADISGDPMFPESRTEPLWLESGQIDFYASRATAAAGRL